MLELFFEKLDLFLRTFNFVIGFISEGLVVGLVLFCHVKDDFLFGQSNLLAFDLIN